MKNLPNKLTALRILAVPLLVVAYYGYDFKMLAVGIFIAASITDWLDGYVARSANQETPLGAFLDPVADKLLVVTVLTILMATHHDAFLTMLGTIIICRELLVSSLREWLAQLNTAAKLTVTKQAKLKTALQMLAIVLLIGAQDTHTLLWHAGKAILFLSVVFSLSSLINYIKIAWPVLTFGINQE